MGSPSPIDIISTAVADVVTNYFPFVLIYLAVISVIAIFLAIKDKFAAKHGKRRTPEALLLGISALGGSVAMFATMLIIRHKTKHVKFMLGIPLIMIVQAALIFALFYFNVF